LVKVFAFLSEQEQEQQQLLKCIFLHHCTTSIISDERTVETQEDLLLFLLQLQHLFDCCESDILRLGLPGSWFFSNGWLQKKWHVTLLGETHRSSARRFHHICDDDDDDVVLVRMLSTRSSSISADLSQWINILLLLLLLLWWWWWQHFCRTAAAAATHSVQPPVPHTWARLLCTSVLDLGVGFCYLAQVASKNGLLLAIKNRNPCVVETYVLLLLLHFILSLFL
jgi:hypothetical protein